MTDTQQAAPVETPVAAEQGQATEAAANAVEAAAEQAGVVLSDEDVAALRSGKIPDRLWDLEYDGKINGKNVKLQLKELRSLSSLGVASHERFEKASAIAQEARQLRAQVEQELADLKATISDPQEFASLLREIVLRDDNASQVVRKVLSEAVSEEQLSPEMRQLKQERRAIERERREWERVRQQELRVKQEAEERAGAADAQKFKNEFANNLARELQNAGLQPSRALIAAGARLARIAETTDTELIAQQLLYEAREISRATIQAKDPSVLEAASPVIKEALIKQAQEAKAQAQMTAPAPTSKKPEPVKRVKFKDWLK